MVTHGVLGTDLRDTRTELPRTIWQWLSGSGILAAIGLLIFLLFLCASFIRQMPGQIADEPAAATRWLLTVSAEYGIWGGALRALGLFDVLHNPMLQLLLALVALVLFVHLANIIAALWRFWSSQEKFEQAVAVAGDPLPLPTTQPLYRLREAVAHTPQLLSTQLQVHVTPHFDEWRTATLTTLPTPVLNGELPSQPPPEGEGMAAVSPVTEWRLLTRRHHHRWIWLRPLLPLGLLIALMAVWIILLAGWEVTPPFLAPGDEYRATTQRLALAYTVEENKASFLPTLAVELDETPQQLPLGESRALQWGQILIQANAGPPALLVWGVDEGVTLSRPGQTQHVTNLGLLFPSLGSEDWVVVENSVGLRVVRVAILSSQASGDATQGSISPLVGPPPEHFLVEVYQRDEAKPVQTIYVSQQMSTTLQVNGAAHTVWLVPLPSLAATVRYQPGIWLLWLAAALIIIGAVGFVYRPAFLIVQVTDWPTARAVVVAQSDLASELAHVRRVLVADI